MADNSAVNGQEERHALARKNMVDKQLRARGITHPGVLAAFEQVPRHRFVPEEYLSETYADRPLPIGRGQTISQPLVVAMMLQHLNLRPDHRILEIGAGSGYQTALLARLAGHVYAIERIEDLAERAMAVLAAINVSNVTLCTGDGSGGWPEEAPFDGIICAAATPAVPETWIEQLADGGRIVIPVGHESSQTLQVVEKDGEKTKTRSICDVRFVKLIGRHGWPA